MATLTTHKTTRATAGAAYTAAAAAYVAAYVELAACDRTVGNNNVGGGAQRSFAAAPVIAGHADFLPSVTAVVGDIGSRIAARHAELIAS